MKSREEAVNLINKQLIWETSANKRKNGYEHYGVCELKELLDFIYESKPEIDSEKLDGSKKFNHRR